MDGSFKDSIRFLYNKTRISIFKTRDNNEYMRNYMSDNKKHINEIRRKKYNVAIEQGKCGRCKKVNNSKFNLCSDCRLRMAKK